MENRIFLSLSALCFIVFTMLFSMELKAQDSIKFSETYSGGVAPTAAQKTDWTNFRALLVSHCYTSVKLSGTYNKTGIKITNSNDVATIANNIRNNVTFQLASGGNNWQYCTNELRINGQAVNYCGSCDAGNCLRPMQSNGNWGGLGGTTCGAGTQTISLVFYYNGTTNPGTITGPQSVCAGQTDVVYSVQSVSGATSYTWSVPAGATIISGDNTNSITVVFSKNAVSGNISVFAAGSCGISSPSVLLLNVNTPPSFIDTIPNMSRCQGEDITFICNASGTTLSYQWTKGGSDIAGATISTFTINNVNQTYSGKYSCKVTNSCGSITLPDFTLTICTPPSLNIKFLKIIKYTGETISLSVDPGGSKPFTFQWIQSGNNIPGGTNSILNINPVSCSDSGLYSCKISNSSDIITFKIAQIYVLNCTPNKYAVYGYVKYENKDSTAMSSKTLNTTTNISLYTLGDTLIKITDTDDNGLYVFTDIAPGNYKLIGSTYVHWSGSNPVDALQVNRSYIGLYQIPGPPSLKRKAADVNIDGKITPTDALMINRRYIGVIDKFVDKNKARVPDWIFSNPTITIGADNISKNITAICTGDVNSSY